MLRAILVLLAMFSATATIAVPLEPAHANNKTWKTSKSNRFIVDGGEDVTVSTVGTKGELVTMRITLANPRPNSQVLFRQWRNANPKIKDKNRNWFKKGREPIREWMQAARAKEEPTYARLLAETGVDRAKLEETLSWKRRLYSQPLQGLQRADGSTVLEPFFYSVKPVSDRFTVVFDVANRAFWHDAQTDQFVRIPSSELRSIHTDYRKGQAPVILFKRNLKAGVQEIAVIGPDKAPEAVLRAKAFAVSGQSVLTGYLLTQGGDLVFNQAMPDGSFQPAIYRLSDGRVSSSPNSTLAFIEMPETVSLMRGASCKDKPHTCDFKTRRKMRFGYGLLNAVGVLPESVGLEERTLYVPIEAGSLKPTPMPDGLIGVVPFMPTSSAPEDPSAFDSYANVYRAWLFVGLNGDDYFYVLVNPTSTKKQPRMGVYTALDYAKWALEDDRTPERMAEFGIYMFDDLALNKTMADGQSYDFVKLYQSDRQGPWIASSRFFGRGKGKAAGFQYGVIDADRPAKPTQQMAYTAWREVRAANLARAKAAEERRKREEAARIAYMKTPAYQAEQARLARQAAEARRRRAEAWQRQEAERLRRNRGTPPSFMDVWNRQMQQMRNCQATYGVLGCEWKKPN